MSGVMYDIFSIMSRPIRNNWLVSPPQACFLFHPLLCQDPNKHKHTKTKTPKKLNRGYDKYKILTILAGGGFFFGRTGKCAKWSLFSEDLYNLCIVFKISVYKKKRSKQCQRHNGPNTAAGKNANSAKKVKLKTQYPWSVVPLAIFLLFGHQDNQDKQNKQNKTKHFPI